MSNSSLKEIYKRIKKAKDVLIITHRIPDADAIGSMLALASIIERLGIAVDTVVTKIPDFALLIPGHEKLKTELSKEYDLIIMVDVSSRGQLACFEYLYDCTEKLIIIDHHAVVLSTDIMHYIDSNAASATMLIYQLAVCNGIDIDFDLANSLYAGLLSDTGGLMHSNVTSEALDMASFLLKKGLNHSDLFFKFVKREYTLDYLYLEKVAIENLEIIDGTIAFCFLDYDSISKYVVEDPADYVYLGRYTKGVEVSILIVEEQPNTYRVSLRSNKYLDVSAVAKQFGGGGHMHASGIRFNDDYDIMKKKIIDQIRKNMEDYK